MFFITFYKFLATEWVFKREPSFLQSYDDLTKGYYVIANSAIQLMTNGVGNGYFEIGFTSVLPYAVSVAATPIFDLTTTTTPVTISISNDSTIENPYNNYNYYPTITATLSGSATSLTITNISDSSRKFQLTGLATGETLVINNLQRYITSSTGLQRISNLYNYNWLYLIKDTNVLQVDEPCTLTFELEFPVAY
jgi:hypothetical protein